MEEQQEFDFPSSQRNWDWYDLLPEDEKREYIEFRKDADARYFNDRAQHVRNLERAEEWDKIKDTIDPIEWSLFVAAFNKARHARETAELEAEEAAGTIE